MLIVFAVLVAPCVATAQTALSGRLGALLTEQDPTILTDPRAAIDTRDTVASLISVELSTLPASSSASGFVYRLNPGLGLVERASDSFGPFFTETVLRNGRGQSSFGVKYQVSNFSSLQGANLEDGTFPTNALRLAGASTPFAVDGLALQLDSSSVVFVGSYGISDRLSLGGRVPIVSVSFSGHRVRIQDGVSTLQSSQSGSATGLGDIAIESRYRVAGHGNRGLTSGVDLRLPTGRADDLLGSGTAALRAIAIASYEQSQLAVHLNGGYGIGGASSEAFWSMATTFAATPRVTLVGEIMGRRLADLNRVQDVYEPFLTQPGVQSMRWIPVESGVATTYLATGAKWNVMTNWLLNANLLVRVTDAGLRARVTPTISMDYDFQR